MGTPGHKAALFVSCLTASVFAEDVPAQLRLLALAGHPDLSLLPAFCCGQPAATAGDAQGGIDMARSFEEAARPFERVFVASATCRGHLAHAGVGGDRIRYAPDVWVDEIRGRSTEAPGSIYLHRPCHDVWDDARFSAYAAWVARTANVTVIAKPFRDACCGFGGVFSTLFDRTAEAMMAHRVGSIEATGTRLVVSAEPGCLSHFAAHPGGLTVVPLASFLVARGIA